MKCRSFFVTSFILTVFGFWHIADLPAADPVATVADASKVIDLRTVAVPERAVVSATRQVGQLTYEVQIPPKAAYEFHRHALLKDGWQELPGASIDATYASGMFSRKGYTLSCSVSSNGLDGDKRATYVTIINLGNVALNQIPVVDGSTSVFANDASAVHSTEMPVPKAAEQMMALLRRSGWQFYGVNPLSDDQHFLNVRKNAVQLSVMIAKAPAQNYRTMISISSQLLSAEIPAPDSAELLQFDGSSKTLRFRTKATFSEISDFYRTQLTPVGWKATSEKANEADDEFGRKTALLAFRNPAMDLMSVEMKQQDADVDVTAQLMTREDLEDAEKKARDAAKIASSEQKKREAEENAARVRAKMEFEQSSAEFDALSNQLIAEALIGSGKKADGKPGKSTGLKKPSAGKTVVHVPAGIKVEAAAENVLKLTVRAGKGATTASSIVESLEADGWNVAGEDISDSAGNYSLKSDAGQINLTFVDTGFTDVTVMVIGIGVDLTSAEAMSPRAKQRGQ